MYAAAFALDAVRDALTASRTSNTAPTAEVAKDDCHDKSGITAREETSTKWREENFIENEY